MKKSLKSSQFLWLLVIVILGIFLRSYRIIETFGFGHDADLFSWIVKDMVVDHHIRLIGQETSTPGIFIGGMFYYLLIPFYLLTGLHPASAILLGLIVGVLTIISYFYVFKKLFDPTAGLVAAFLQAVIPNRVAFDRWIVPTITVNLWCIWYFFTIFKLSRGSFNYLVLAGILGGLIWHVHIALAPLLILIPLAVFFSKKWPSLKQIALFLTGFSVPMLPFFVFEIRHGFSQIINFYYSFFLVPEDVEIIYGGGKIDDVIRQSIGENYWLNATMLIGLILLPKFKILNRKMLTLILIWVVSVLGFFAFTKKLISEYYFENIRTIVLILMILYISWLLKKNRLFKTLALGILIFILVNSVNVITNLPLPGNGYLVRSKVVEYIKNDSVAKRYPCISVTHITKPGEDFGYRYLYWFNKIKMARDSALIPNYTIVFPYELATESARFRNGAINVIPPQKEYNLEQVAKNCPEVDYNLTALFWGFTK